ncbi:MAG: invasion associated locus B family protein, partial [Pseudomonadota bacterium]|nr:invasion associated locus B family protein [Pseudomonadota bacterium]
VVSVVAGYTFATDSEVEVRISGRKFKMFTQDDRAWTENGKADAKLVQAMKRGMKMEVRGRSSRGTKTRDIYSLKGFTAGMRMIDKACAG